jgi:hypothetical protein
VAVSSRHARHLGGLLAVVAHAVGLVGDEQIDARARAQRIAVQRHALIRRHDDEVRVAIVTHGGQLLELELVVQARLARAGEHDGELVLGLAEPALELGLPVLDEVGRRDDEDAPRLPGGDEGLHEGDGLQRLAEAGIVAEDAADGRPPVEPAHAGALVRMQHRAKREREPRVLPAGAALQQPEAAPVPAVKCLVP